MRAVYWVVTPIAALFFVLFAVSNRAPVSLELWPLPFLVDLPLFLVVLLVLLAGFGIGATAMWLAGRRLRRELRRRRRRVDALERELAAARSGVEGQAIGSHRDRSRRSAILTAC